QGEKSADGSKVQNGYTLPFTAADGAAIVAEGTRYPLYTYKKDGKELTNRWLPAARLITGMAAQQPKLTLDLVPTGRPGEFKLTFEGKPLPKKKVTLMTQSGWGKDKTTDAQGLVQFDMPWKGPYVA